jgi:hypothetical protein
LTHTAISVSGGSQIVGNSIAVGSINANLFALVSGNLISQSPDTGLSVSQVTTTSNNRVDHSKVGIAAGDGLVADNLLADDTIGLSLTGTPVVVSNTVLGSNDTAVDLTSTAVDLHGNNLLAAPGHYALRNDAGSAATAVGNWWGTASDSAIEALIYDDQKDGSLGAVDHSGFLSGPVPTAPAYVQDLGIEPDTTLGIQTGTFDVHFSRPMDTNRNAGLGFYPQQRGAWTAYTASNSGLPDDYVWPVAVDLDGDVWFGTPSGAARLRGSEWTVYGGAGSVFRDGCWVTSLAAGSDGSMWFGYCEGGIAQFNGTTWITNTLPNYQDGYVQSIAPAPDGTVWLGTTLGGAFHFDGSHWTAYTTANSGLPSNVVHSVALDDRGNKWFGTDEGVARFDGSQWKVFNATNSPLPSDRVEALASDGNGGIWAGLYECCAQGGLAHFDGTNWRVWNAANSGLPATQIGQIVRDRDGSIWFSEEGSNSGLVHFMDGTWQLFAPNGSDGPNVMGVAIDANRDIWITVFVSGVRRLTWGLDYPIIDNGRWLDDHTWQATYDFTSIIPHGTYTVTVANAAGQDHVQMDPDSRYSLTVDYASTITDKTPPSTPSVSAHSAAGNPGYVTAQWSATDPNSPIIHYRYAIGSAPGALDVVNWTTLDATTVTRTGLGLTSGKHYWVSVQAQNQGGLWSPAGASQFTAGAKNPLFWLPVVRR